MKKYLPLFLLLITFSTEQIFAQNKYVDSLQLVVNQNQATDQDRFSAYYKLTEWFRVEENYTKAEAIIKKHLEFAERKKNEVEVTKAEVNQGIVYVNQEEFEKGVLQLEKIKARANKSKIANAYTSYLEAYITLNNGDSETALKLFQQLETTLEDEKEYSLLAKIYYNLYGIFSNLNDVENTMLYTQKMINEAKISTDKNLISNAYSALAVAYTLRYDTEKSSSDLQQIIEVSKSAVALGNQFKDQIGSRTNAIAKLNLASYYLKYYPEKTSLIKETTKEALKAAETAVGNQTVLASCYGILSHIAQQENNMAAAVSYLLDAFQILSKQQPIYYYSIIMVSDDLATLYQKMGNYEKAFHYQKLTTSYNLELYNQEQASSVKKIEAQYQFKKKEKEVALLKERSESQRKQKLLYAGLAIIGLIGSFFMYRSYHYHLKYSLQKEKKLVADKHEADLQIKLEKEEQSRLKAEQELAMLKQQQLQDEVMASQLQIQHKNNVLQKLKVKLEDDKSVNIKQILKEENLFDNDFEKVKFEIQEIHPNFFNVLNQNAAQKLTSLDLKYCAYIYLGMETKQIANLLNVEAKSVRMTKYRLKQKLGLGAEVDLLQFIKSLQQA
ncbi:LuxR C-terminal-related transcriptional regulator [Flavobacterium sp. xlx-221]|uniref:helix-turn-helix transcriptional regulator n=2 Tax=unclassified Flavobacterium TaxID=196869 RepID=UPI001C711111|nr:LuxR C-terminal-related transcriptional regulator [Flavobacterium sp. xlx-221]